MLTVIILTRDEELHVARAVGSVMGIADHVLVVDSGSTDRTVEIAQGFGAQVLVHPWRNHAAQFNWALEQVPAETRWILRLDADEYVTPALAVEIGDRLPRLGSDIEGVIVSRRMCFMGRPIRWGGVFPVRLIRLFRHGAGRCEERWMDEHIVISGPTVSFTGEIIDDNRNSLSWWTTKHNHYASREVIDMLNLRHRFLPHESVAALRGGGQTGTKRWIKDKFYARLPVGLRALAYFLYRYVIRLGFLDGIHGTAFHVLQGFWYRYLVDMKLYEVETALRENKCDVVSTIRTKLGIDVAVPGEKARS